MVVVGIGLYLVAVTQGLLLVLDQLVDLPRALLLVAVWGSYTLFTFLSGSQGVLVNDTIMFVVFTVAAILGMGWVIGAAGGPVVAMQRMAQLTEKPNGIAWHGLTGADNYMGSSVQILIYAVTFGIVWATVVAVSPWQSSRFLMARNEHVAIRSALFATAALSVTYLFLTFGGFSINLFNADIDPSEVAFIWTAENVLPSLLGVIAVTGIVAAGLSSAASFLSLIGFSAANDVMPYLLRTRRQLPEPTTAQALGEVRPAPRSTHYDRDVPRSEQPAPGTITSHTDDDDVKGLWVARWTMLIAGLAVLGITFVAPPAVLTIGYFAATLFAASWGPIAFWSVQSDRLTARGATVGMLAGFTTVAAFESLTSFGEVTLPSLLNPTVLGFTTSIVGTLLGNIGVRPSANGIAFRRRMLVVPEEDRNSREFGITRVYVFVTIGILALSSVLLIVFYVVPYSSTL